MAYIKLSIAALAPVIFSIVFYLLDERSSFSRLTKRNKQIIYGVVFGILAIAGTEMGIPYYGAQLNCRDAAVLTAGLMFGGPAGIIAGAIGAAERWFSVYWGVGAFTRVACTVSTLIAGVYAAALRKYMFDHRRPEWLIALTVGVVMEVFHLTMVFITNMDTPYDAILVVQICSVPMITANGLSVMLSSLVLGIISRSVSWKIGRKEDTHIAQIIQRWLLIPVLCAFGITTLFLVNFQSEIAAEQVSAVMAYAQPRAYQSVRSVMQTTKSIVIYANIYTEILVFAVMFASIYILLKIEVVDQLHNVNRKLARITNGNLDVVVDVNTNREFAKLSRDINSTVDTLKRYIDEASARLDKELEVAKEIQTSSLPSATFDVSVKKNFDFFADMHTAKEVGGDFYDYYMTGDNILNFTIADVSGKGIPAAMFMMRARTELNKQSKQLDNLCDVFTNANNSLCEGNEAEMFVTACQGRVNLKTGEMSFVNAGHNPPIIKHSNGKVEYYRTKPGFVLAGMEGINYKEQKLQLQAGDIFFLYTDGVTEATNAQNELFGEDRLLEVITRAHTENMEDLCKHVKSAIDDFVKDAPQFDDITMVAFRYKETEKRYYEMAEIATIQEMTEYVEEKLAAAGCSMPVAVKFSIAIDEIASNIIKYGYNGNPGPIQLEVINSDEEVGLIITDWAKEFNPLYQQDPDVTASLEDRKIGGLGLYMVKKSMDLVDYKYEDGKNILTITRNREKNSPIL